MRSPVSALPAFGEKVRALSASFVTSSSTSASDISATGRSIAIDAEIAELDLREDLIGHGVGEVGVAGQDLLRRALVLRELEVGLESRAFAAIGQRVARHLVDDALHDFGHSRPAVQASKVTDGHLARPKTLDADLILELIEPRREPVVQFGGRHDHLEFPPQPLDHPRIDLHSL